jgi:AcrR family transcriptional regulator
MTPGPTSRQAPRSAVVPKRLRADAARNRVKLLSAAADVFGQRGLDAPLEHIARQAGVSIGTLYAHFPTREAFFDAILPERMEVLDRIAADALADPDPWHGFVLFVEGLFTLRAQDRGLNDALAQRAPLSPLVAQACQRGVEHAEAIINRARHSGQLRPDFQPGDLGTLSRALSHVIREAANADSTEWRRCLMFLLDGLKTDPATPTTRTTKRRAPSPNHKARTT